MNRRAQLICVWAGPVLTVLFLIGAVILGRFIPPGTHPSDSAQKIADFYAQHTDRERIGAFLSIISMSLVAPFGISIAAQTRRREGRFPSLTYVQLTCVAIGTAVVVLMCMCWGLAAFRPADQPVEITRFANDLAYFLFLFTWTPFSIWVASIALAIFLDDRPVYPRYVGWLNVWVCVLFVPAGLMAFFKHGAFSWAGLMSLYVPVGIFFVWLVVMFIETRKNILGGDYEEDGPAPAATADPRALAGVN